MHTCISCREMYCRFDWYRSLISFDAQCLTEGRGVRYDRAADFWMSDGFKCIFDETCKHQRLID